MTSSLVGSEMCIRDRLVTVDGLRVNRELILATQKRLASLFPSLVFPVSYTHLTLPTICSV
eukprot:9857073-Prorocentrum_lima.AAC.1